MEVRRELDRLWVKQGSLLVPFHDITDFESAPEGYVIGKGPGNTLAMVEPGSPGGGGGGGGGGLVLIDEVTLSGAATADVAGASDDYDHYIVDFCLVPSSDDVELTIRLSSDGGSSFDAGASSYHWHWRKGRSGSTADSDDSWGANNDNKGHLASHIGNAAGEGIAGRIHLPNLRHTGMHKVWWAHMANLTQLGEAAYQEANGARLSTAAFNAVRLLFTLSGTPTGTIASGWVRLYGVTKTAGSGSAPDWLLKQPGRLPDTPNAADDHFEVGTALDTAGTRRAGATAWIKTNWGTTTDAIVDGVLKLVAPAGAGANLRLAEQPVAGATWKYRARLAMLTASVNFCTMGIAVRNSANGRVITHARAHTGGFKFESNRWNSVTSYNSSITESFALANKYQAFDWCWFEVEYNGTNIIFRHSWTGADGTFETFRSETPAAFLSAAPTHVGLVLDSENSQPVTLCCDVFLKVA